MSASDDTYTYYDVLGVPNDASIDAIKAAYRRKIRDYHDDRLPPETSAAIRELAKEKAAELNEAYKVLRDPTRKGIYDANLAALRNSRYSSQSQATTQPPPTPGSQSKSSTSSSTSSSSHQGKSSTKSGQQQRKSSSTASAGQVPQGAAKPKQGVPWTKYGVALVTALLLFWYSDLLNIRTDWVASRFKIVEVAVAQSINKSNGEAIGRSTNFSEPTNKILFWSRLSSAVPNETLISGYLAQRENGKIRSIKPCDKFIFTVSAGIYYCELEDLTLLAGSYEFVMSFSTYGNVRNITASFTVRKPGN